MHLEIALAPWDEVGLGLGDKPFGTAKIQQQHFVSILYLEITFFP